MKVKEVQERVAKIAAYDDDDEAQHAEEDGLHLDVLQAIAGGARNARALATEAVKTADLDFSRWYA